MPHTVVKGTPLNTSSSLIRLVSWPFFLGHSSGHSLDSSTKYAPLCLVMWRSQTTYAPTGSINFISTCAVFGFQPCRGGEARGEDQGKDTWPTQADLSTEINMTVSELARESTTTYFFSFQIRSLPPDWEHSLVSSPGSFLFCFVFIELRSNPWEMLTTILEPHGGREPGEKTVTTVKDKA